MLQLHLSDQQFIAYYCATYIRSLTVIKNWEGEYFPISI